MPVIRIAALLLAPAAEDNAFCDALKQIVAAAPGDYRAIAGAPDDKMMDGLRGHVTPEIDGGWDFCDVTFDGDGKHGAYLCLVNRGNVAPTDAEVAALANRTAACFGAQVRELDGIPGPKAFGYPQRRQIALPPVKINVTALRADEVQTGSWHRLPRYLAAKPAHSYELYIEFRTIDPDRPDQ
jgi:hypothetical protein